MGKRKKEKTIPQKKSERKPSRLKSWLRWLILIPFALLFLLFTFVLAGYSFSALVCCAIMGIILFYNCTDLLKNRFPKTMKILRRVFTVCLVLGLLVCGITECFVIKASFGDPEAHCDYMVVLGAKVRHDGPSVSLQNRIDAAYEYLTAHPDVTCIVSGGQGPDEPMSEAQCMFDRLTAMGIDPSRIWLEDKATSTWENLNFTLDLIEENTGIRPTKLGILSSEYHLFRAGLFADACGIECIGIPARTTRFSQMVNHFMREVAGVWHYLILGGQYD